MINTVFLFKITTGGAIAPDSLLSVQAYTYHSGDADGSVPGGTLIGSMTEVSGTGTYTIDNTAGQKVTIVVGGLCRDPLIGIWLIGDEWAGEWE